MSALVGTVWVRKDWASEPVAFGPDSKDIPGWALEQMGDHCFEDGKRPGSGKKKDKKSKSSDSGSGSEEKAGYTGTNAELQSEIDKRNEGRDDEDKVVVEGRVNKPSLVAALEADDAKHQQ